MIRKALIVALTAGALGTFVGSVYRGPARWFIPRLGSERKMWIQLSGPTFTIGYSAPGDSTMPEVRQQWHGFQLLRGRMYAQPANTYETTLHALTLPRWVAVILLASYPVVALIRGPGRRWQRRRGGRCLKCAYNLTGNTTGVCSECGTRVQPR